MSKNSVLFVILYGKFIIPGRGKKIAKDRKPCHTMQRVMDHQLENPPPS